MLIVRALIGVVGISGVVGVCCWNHSTNALSTVLSGDPPCCAPASTQPDQKPPTCETDADNCAIPPKSKETASSEPPAAEGSDCCTAPPTNNATEPGDGITTVALSVEGMTCSRCVDSVRAALAEIPGVIDATISMEQSEALIRVDAKQPPTTASMIEAIEKSGQPRHNFLAAEIDTQKSVLWQQQQPQFTLLSDSIDPFVDQFNKNAGKPRFVALLSSTCPLCVAGANAVQHAVLKVFPDADAEVIIVWIDMYKGDGDDSVKRMAATFDDPRVSQFYDVARLAGKAFSESLLVEGSGPAWDVYLFFDRDAEWTDGVPEPTDWFHQLDAKQADPSRYRTGDALSAQLRATAEKLFHSRPQPNAKETTMPTLVFLTRGGCVNTPIMRANLDVAIERLALDSDYKYEVVNQDSLPPTDPRVGYPTPTLLIDGTDMFGLPVPTPPFPNPG